MKKVLMSVAVGAAFIMAAGSASAQTLNQVKSRGVLQCGSNTGLAGFGQPDAQGNWTGLDVDYCRAMAAAIFNDPTKVKFVPLSAKDQRPAMSPRSSGTAASHALPPSKLPPVSPPRLAVRLARRWPP